MCACASRNSLSINPDMNDTTLEVSLLSSAFCKRERYFVVLITPCLF